MDQEIRKLQLNLSETESALNATKANSNNLDLRVSQMLGEHNKLKHSLDDYRNTIQSLKTERSLLQSTLSDKSKRIQHIELKLQSMAEKNQDLIKQINE